MLRCQPQESSSTNLLFKKPGDVIIKGIYHQKHQEKETHLQRHLTVSQRNRPADDGFNQEEKQIAAVQYRNRQEVEHPQVDTENRQKGQKLPNPSCACCPAIWAISMGP